MNLKGFSNTALLIALTIGSGLLTFGINRMFNTSNTPTVTTVETMVVEQPKVTNSSTDKSISVDKKNIKQLNLNGKQIITIDGEISGESYFVAKQIIALGKSGKPIYILLNSPGGSVLDGALIVSAIEGSPVPVYTVVEGLCASMCQIIHAYGTKRMMTDRTILMGHPASGGVSGTLEQMQSRLSMIQRYVNKFNAYIAKRAGLTLNAYLTMVVSEMWLDAEDATNMHFNDEIVSINLKVMPALPISILEEKKRNDLKRLYIKW